MNTRNQLSVVALWLLFSVSLALSQAQDQPIETRIDYFRTIIRWSNITQSTHFDYSLRFTIGGKKVYSDLYYSDSYDGRRNIDMGDCFYQQPGEERQRLPKDWIKTSNAFEQYILCSDKYLVEWTINNIPVGTIVELNYSTAYDRYLDFLSIPLQYSWDIDSMDILFEFDSEAMLSIQLQNADSLDAIKSERAVSLGKIPKWEARPYDGGFSVASAVLYCHINANDNTRRSWQDVSSTINKWWSNLDLSLPLRKLSDHEKNMIDSVPDDCDQFERTFRYVAILARNHGFIPHAPKEVLKNKYGDCKDLSLLFSQFCQQNGVEAYPVLVNLPAKDPFFPDIPTPYQFNHCIVAYKRDQDTIYYDPTTRGYAVKQIPWSLQGAYALWLTPENMAIITIPVDLFPLQFSRTIHGELFSNDEFEGNISIRYDERLPRTMFDDVQDKDIQEYIRGNISDDFSVVLSDVAINKENYVLSSSVKISRLAKKAGSKVYLTPNLFEYADYDISKGVSDAGYFFGRPAVYCDSVIIQLPDPLEMPISLSSDYSNELVASTLNIDAIENSLKGYWKSGFLVGHFIREQSTLLESSIDTLKAHRTGRIALSCSP